MSELDTLKEVILSGVDHGNHISGMCPLNNRITFGDYVLSGINITGTTTLGYVVQIREKWGAFGSHTFFVREPDGSLGTHENQSFWKLTEAQVALVKPFFEDTPAEELKANPDIKYSIKHKYEEAGFIIPKTNAPARVDSCAIAVTTSGS